MPAFYCINNDVGFLANYEAELDYFPVNYKADYEAPPDYILAWRMKDHDKQTDLMKDYDLLHSGQHYSLYGRKKAKLDESLWEGKTVIKFDMQPKDGKTAHDSIPISPDTVYIGGRYGWATQSEREAHCSDANLPEPLKDCIFGDFDGVFRVALPNGTYKITSHFCADENPYKLNIIANGKKAVRGLKVPSGDETVEANYTITVTDERLTQVVYATGKAQEIRWGWASCSIERSE